MKERCMEAYTEEKSMVKRCIYQSKKKVNEQCRKKMNQVVNGNRKLFGKEVSKMNRGKVENSSGIKNGNRRLAKCKGFGRSIFKTCLI